MRAARRCVLCRDPNVAFEVASDGRVIEGHHKGREVKKGDLICYDCMLGDLAKDANGAFVLVNSV